MRRIPLSHRSHITGFQILPVSGLTEHESALERDFVVLTTFCDSAARTISQPITLSFLEGQTARRYTPDFLVHWSDGRSELVEVKYRTDLCEHWPLSLVQIDHTLVDVIVVDSVTRKPIERPWITLAIDVHSRCVPGFYLSLDPPSATSVAL